MGLIIFLDYDGVLNTPKNWGKWTYPDPVPPLTKTLIKRLKKFVQETNAEIVIHSTWRNLRTREETIQDLGEWVRPHLGFGQAWRVEPGDKSEQISNWLEANATSAVRYIVLDDTEIVGHPQILVDYTKGLTEQNIEDILNNVLYTH